MQYGKTIEMFLIDGDASGLVTAELSNWNGKAIKIPRTMVKDCARDDIKGVGIYFLFCEEDGADAVYIGEAENVLDRLIQHLRDYQSSKEEYYWTTAVAFVSHDLNKALIRYLEDRIWNEINECGRMKNLTKNTYKKTVLKGSRVSDGIVKLFIEHGGNYYSLRCKLEADGIIADGEFQSDFEFSAPSAASAVALGRTSNGNVDWKTADGIKLKDL